MVCRQRSDLYELHVPAKCSISCIRLMLTVPAESTPGACIHEERTGLECPETLQPFAWRFTAWASAGLANNRLGAAEPCPAVGLKLEQVQVIHTFSLLDVR